eukprot:Filipodium_phascolosomae@DN5738_c0_g1_i1.p1
MDRAKIQGLDPTKLALLTKSSSPIWQADTLKQTLKLPDPKDPVTTRKGTDAKVGHTTGGGNSGAKKANYHKGLAEAVSELGPSDFIHYFKESTKGTAATAATG